MNGIPGAVLLSIHQNSLPSSPATRGAQAFFNGQPGARALAESVQAALNGAVNGEHEKQAAQAPSSVYLMKSVEAPRRAGGVRLPLQRRGDGAAEGPGLSDKAGGRHHGGTYFSDRS